MPRAQPQKYRKNYFYGPVHITKDYRDIQESSQQNTERKYRQPHNWTKDPNHQNWLYFLNLRSNITTLEERFTATRDPDYLIKVQHIEELKNRLLYNGEQVQAVDYSTLQNFFRVDAPYSAIPIQANSYLQQQQPQSNLPTPPPYTEQPSRGRPRRRPIINVANSTIQPSDNSTPVEVEQHLPQFN